MCACVRLREADHPGPEMSAEGAPLSPQYPLRRTLFAAGSAAAGALLLTVVAFGLAWNLEEENIRAEFDHEAEAITNMVELELDGAIRDLQAVSWFYAASREVTPGEFSRFVQPLLVRRSALAALAWAPRIRSTTRRSNEPRSAAEPEEVFPVILSESRSALVWLHGFNLQREPQLLPALAEARDTGGVLATAPLVLGDGRGEEEVVLLLRPVYGPAFAPATVEARRASLRGYLVGVFVVHQAIEDALRNSGSQEFSVTLLDAATGRPLYPPKHPQATGQPAPAAGAGSVHRFQRETAGRTWLFEFRPRPDYFARRRSWQPWGMLAGGLFASLLLAVFLAERHRAERAIRGWNATLEQRVQQRTAELEATNRALAERSASLDALVRNSPLAIVVLDAEHRILLCNPAFERLFQYRQEEIVGQKLDELIAGPFEQQAADLTQRGLAGELVHTTAQRRRRDGSLVDVEIHGVPLRIEGRLCGTFALYQDISERRRSELALERTRAELAAKVRELEQMNLRARRLNELAELLQSCHNTAEAYALIRQRMRQFFPEDAGVLAVVSASRNMVETVSSWGESLRCERVFAPADCWALRRGQPHRVDDPAADPVCPHVPQPGAGGYLCVPMTAQGEALGILHLQWGPADPVQPEAHHPREDRIQLAIALGEHLGLALANMRLRESLRAQSIRDPLTGLFNRRYLEESLERELRRAMRKHRPLAAVLFDLDHFKQFNDTFGHAAGDALLAELGRFLQERIRADDIACRYGGEEFVLILPESSLQETRQRVEGLRLEFERLHVEHRGLALGTVTLSAGVAVFPEHATTADALLRQADRALYRAKEQGRNRVVVAEPLETGAILEPER